MTQPSIHREPRGTGHPPARKVLVVVDHRTVADLFAHVIDEHPRLRCTGVETGLAGVPDRLVATRPDVAVVDVRLGHGRGLAAAEVVRRSQPRTAVVMLTAAPEPWTLLRARSLGVSAVLDRHTPLTQVLHSVLTARPGRTGPAPRPATAAIVPSLTNREDDVLRGLAQGHDPGTIARTLGISRNTCRGYVQQLLEKLGAHSQLEAVALARRAGLLRGLDLEV